LPFNTRMRPHFALAPEAKVVETESIICNGAIKCGACTEQRGISTN
jgi:hypothetical protein